MRRRVRTLGLDAAVRMTGFRRDIPEVMAALDVLVLPSIRSEAASQVIPRRWRSAPRSWPPTWAAAARSCATGQTGRLVPAGDVAALAAAIAVSLIDRAARPRDGPARPGPRARAPLARRRHDPDDRGVRGAPARLSRSEWEPSSPPVVPWNQARSVNIHVFATDYDGTIAEGNRVSEATARALERVRATGRKLLLVTGRMLPDLQAVCPELERMFDAVVAENGALVYFPERREMRTLGDAPEPALIAALERRGVVFAVGGAILATEASFAEAALAAIQETGVERTLVFNKGALMLLPGGVTKGTGLAAALAALELSPHNMVGIGDAENDHAFLSMCECAVAVADAVPALRERADYVTRAAMAAQGTVEFIEEHLLNDLVDICRGSCATTCRSARPRTARRSRARARHSPAHHRPLGQRQEHADRGAGRARAGGRALDAACSIPRATTGRWPRCPGSSCSAARASRRCRRPRRSTSSCATRGTSLVLDLSAMTVASRRSPTRPRCWPWWPRRCDPARACRTG